LRNIGHLAAASAIEWGNTLRFNNINRGGLAAAVLVTIGTDAAHASGFALPEYSAFGIGTTNAAVANPREPGAFPYNPAAMSFHDRSSVALGALFINPHFSVRNQTGRRDSNGADWFAAPMVQAALRFDQRWSAGLAVTAPFGLETRWKVGTFPALTGPFSPHPTQSKLEVVNITPTVSYRLVENLAISAGVDYYRARSARLKSSLTDLEGSGDAWGFNLSALYRQGALSLGVNFRSAVQIGLSGQLRALSPVLVQRELLPPAQPVGLDLDLPWRLQLGARYQIDPRLAVEFNWSHTGWSKFDELKAIGQSTGQILVQDENRWDDANAYRLAVTYDLRPRTQLRLGYTYDQTGQRDRYFSARVPDSDRHLFAIGLGQQLDGGWRVDAGYMLVRFEDRTVRGHPYRGGGDINGTSTLDGRYEAHAHLFGIEISKAFDLF